MINAYIIISIASVVCMSLFLIGMIILGIMEVADE